MTAARLRELRAATGWSRERLSRALGVSQATIVRWEAGAAIPGPAAIALESVLGARIAEMARE